MHNRVEALKGGTRIGIGSHIGKELSHEGFSALLQISGFSIAVKNFLSPLARDSWLFKKENWCMF